MLGRLRTGKVSDSDPIRGIRSDAIIYDGQTFPKTTGKQFKVRDSDNDFHKAFPRKISRDMYAQ